MAKLKTGKNIKPDAETLEFEEMNINLPQPEVKKKSYRHSNEYSRGISKIASYAGTVRRMKVKKMKIRHKNDDGTYTDKWDDAPPYDEIINIYVNPGGEIVSYDRDRFINMQKGSNSISKQAVRNHGNADKSIWYKREKEEGYSPSSASRRSKPVKSKSKRVVKKVIRARARK